MVEWTVSGSLKPRLEQEGTAIAFCNTGDQSVLRYSGLKAWDATGRSLPAKLTVRSNDPKGQLFRIAYVIDAADASYPVMIDPLFTQVKKLLPKGGPGDVFGYSVSISGDTVVVGGFYDNGTYSGSVYIFDRDQGGPDNWGQVKKITTPGVDPFDYFGYSVSISGDTVVVGAYADDANGFTSGSAYIFYRDQGGPDNWGAVKKIIASDGAGEDRFGYSVSISGDTVVIGAYGDNDNGIRSGSAYIFYRDQGWPDNWGQVKKITASDGAADDFFSNSVSISGDTVVVGAPNDDDNGTYSGSAYIFDRDQGGIDNWGQVQKIVASDGAERNEFGYSVSISGDTVVVGAPFDDDNGLNSGSAYVFYRDQGGADTWGQVTKITASDGTAPDEFGRSVSINGDTVVVGAFRDDDNGIGSGSAYIFYRDQGGTGTWGQVTKITASDGTADDRFGYSVSISGDTVLVGAYYDNDDGTNSGSAYVFYRDQGSTDNWGQVTKINPSDGAEQDYFGYSVSVSADTVVVGAYRDDDNGIDSGSAYIYYRDQGGIENWGQVKKITAADGLAGDEFGRSVSISADTVVVGAFRNDDYGLESGAAYIFDRDRGGLDNWGQVKKIIASDPAAYGQIGLSVSISSNTVVVGANSSGYIFDRDRGGPDNWGQVKKITASDGAAYDRFGESVSISGDTVVVGRRFDTDNGSFSGSAYIFDRDQDGIDNWGQVKKINASDGAAYDQFGYSVSISADTLVVGAPDDDDNASGYGSAYIFDRDQGGPDNWGQARKITASDVAWPGNFGKSVSISGDTVVVGAEDDDDNGSESGSVYIFDRDQGGPDNWGQVQKIIASDGAANDQFGGSVSISGDTLVVGAYGDDANAFDSGSSYVFLVNYLSMGDFEPDGDVDGSDLSFFSEAYAVGDLIVDLNGNGIIDAGDLAMFSENYGR